MILLDDDRDTAIKQEPSEDAPPRRKLNFNDSFVSEEDDMHLDVKMQSCSNLSGKIQDRLQLFQATFREKDCPPEFDVLLDTLLNFCQKT